MKKIRQIPRQFSTRTKVAAAAIILTVVAAGILTFVLSRHTTVTPNDRPPTTGVSLLFNPPLSGTATLEIDSSNGKKLKTVTLARTKTTGIANSAQDPHGMRYNIPLNEGVYKLTVSSPTNAFPPFIQTATISSGKLTIENIGFASVP